MSKYFNKRNFFILLLICIIFIPIILNYLISIYSGGIADDKTWLSFWATWLGAILGGSITLIGLMLTLEDGRKRDENKSRLEILPFLCVSNINHDDKVEIFNGDGNLYSFYFNMNKFNPEANINVVAAKTRVITFNLKVRNIGIGLATNVEIKSLNGKEPTGWESNKVLDHLFINKNDYALVKIEIHTEQKRMREIETVRMIISFNDIIGNRYKQLATVHLREGDSDLITTILNLTSPELDGIL